MGFEGHQMLIEFDDSEPQDEGEDPGPAEIVLSVPGEEDWWSNQVLGSDNDAL